MSKLVRLEKIKFPNTISQLSNFDMSAEYFVVKQASPTHASMCQDYTVSWAIQTIFILEDPVLQKLSSKNQMQELQPSIQSGAQQHIISCRHRSK